MVPRLFLHDKLEHIYFHKFNLTTKIYNINMARSRRVAMKQSMRVLSLPVEHDDSSSSSSSTFCPLSPLELKRIIPARKSSSRARKVQFSPVDCHCEIPHLSDYSEEERLNYWYNPESLKSMRRQADHEERCFRAGKDAFIHKELASMLLEDQDFPFRMRIARESVHAVLEEQQQQLREKSLSKNMKTQALHQRYVKATEGNQLDALCRALQLQRELQHKPKIETCDIPLQGDGSLSCRRNSMTATPGSVRSVLRRRSLDAIKTKKERRQQREARRWKSIEKSSMSLSASLSSIDTAPCRPCRRESSCSVELEEAASSLSSSLSSL